MKKLLATMLALVMALALLPTAVFAAEPAAFPADVGSDGTYTLSSDVKLTESFTINEGNITRGDTCGVININGDMTFDGNGKTITAGTFTGSDHHIINVENGATVTIKNLTIVGNTGTKHGINVYSPQTGNKTTVILQNVTIKNCGGAAVIVNNAEVTATNLTTSGSGWGYAVNVDKGGKLTLDTTANLAESFKVYSEKRTDSQCVVNIGNNSQYVLATDTGYCYSSNAADLGVAAIDKNVYATLTDAVAAIGGNRVGTITLLKDCEGDGVVVDDGKGITFDLNGHKYTINKTVGSAGTETNGMQFIKGSEVTIKNGEFVFNNAKMGIKNYCDLTLDNVVMTNTAKADPVVNNCGQLTVNGANTKISSNYKWAITTGNYGKGDVITTTINAGEISGIAIETPQWEVGGSTPNESVTTTINGGTVGKLGTWDWATDGSYGDKYKDAPQLTNWKFIVNDGAFETFDFSGKYTDKVSFYGGTFGVNPAAYVHDANYAVTKGTDGKYTVAKAADNSTSSVILPTTSGSGTGSGSASTSTETTATITKSDIDTNKGLVVKDASENNVTSVTFNSKAADTIVTTAEGVGGDESVENLTLTVTTKEGKDSTNVANENKDAYAEATENTDTTNAVVVSIDLKAGDTKLFTASDVANATDEVYAIVEVPYKIGLKDVTVQYLDGSEVKTLTKVAVLSDLGGKAFDANNYAYFYYNSTTGVITMKLPHFSQYLLNGTVPVVNPTLPTTYTVTYNAGANGSGTVAAGTKTRDVAMTLSSTGFTRSGYTQIGWATTDGGAKAYDMGGQYTANESVTLYPVWQRNHRPSRPSSGSSSTTTTTPTVAAPKTFDAGIAIYGVMAISSVLGMGYVGKKKF